MKARRVTVGIWIVAASIATWLASCVGDAPDSTTGNGDGGPDGDGQTADGASSEASADDAGAEAGCPGGVCNGNDVIHISMGGYYACAVLRRGTVWCWGGDSSDALGPVDAGLESCHGGSCRVEPGEVAGLADVVQIASGGEMSCALEKDGSVWCWGLAARDALGGGASPGPALPRKVPSLAGVTQIGSAGYYAMCAISGGSVYCWGSNLGGNLGRGDTPSSDSNASSGTPEAVVGLPNDVVEVRGDDGDPGSPCARTNDGGVWCWGCNFWGTLGHSSSLDTATTTYYANECNSTPLQVSGISATALLAGTSTWCAKTSTGTISCWGFNGYAELGRTAGGDQSQTNITPAGVVGLPQMATGFQGETHGRELCAIDSTGTLWCWGEQNRGQLGDGVFGVLPGGAVDAGQVGCSFDPTQPCNGLPHAITEPTAFASHRVVEVSANGTFGTDTWATIALLDDGSVWTWGDNDLGQLGSRTGIGADSTCAGGVPCNPRPGQVTGLPAR